MADRSAIEWTEATWNPIAGCSVISPGCTNCYAMREAGGRLRSAAKFRGLTEPSKAGPVWNGDMRFWEKALDQPLRWSKPRRIFVNSMSDLFHESVPDEWIDRVSAVMARCPQHTFQVLTKRAERMRDYMTGSWRVGDVLLEQGHQLRDWPLPNVWLGVSAEDQVRADERIPLLLRTPAAVRWVSYEPGLGPVDFACVAASPPSEVGVYRTINALTGKRGHMGPCGPTEAIDRPTGKLDWVVIGGESGPGARPFDIGWARSIIGQCKAAAVPVFVKQLGAVPVVSPHEDLHHWCDEARFGRPELDGYRVMLRSRKGGDPAEWADDLRIREYPRGSV